MSSIVLGIRRPEMTEAEVQIQKAIDDERENVFRNHHKDPRKSLIEIDLNIERTDPNVFVIRKYSHRSEKGDLTSLEVSRVPTRVISDFNTRLSAEWDKLIEDAYNQNPVAEIIGNRAEGIPSGLNRISTNEMRHSDMIPLDTQMQSGAAPTEV